MPPLTLGSFVGAVLLVAHAEAYITYLEVRLPLQGNRAPRGSVWPEPQLVMPSKLQRHLVPGSFRITTNDVGTPECDVLAKATVRYAKLLFFNAMKQEQGAAMPTGKRLDRLDVNVSLLAEQYCRYPRYGDDESYNLTVPVAGDAFLNATTVWGALRGLETFSQLFYQDPDTKEFLVNVTSLRDYPRFFYRGLLVDCVTRFLPVKTLKRNLDAMAYNKFNVFHWFLADGTAWRLRLAAFPNLTTVTRLPRHMYQPQDVEDVVEHARLRGIRVIPEFAIASPPKLLRDALPGLVALCPRSDEQHHEAPHPKDCAWDVVDLWHGPTYDAYAVIFREVASLFKDEYMHLGGKLHPSTLPSDAQPQAATMLQLYMDNIINLTRSLGFKTMVWHDLLSTGVRVPRDAVVQLCRSEDDVDSSTIQQLAKAGHQLVFSSKWNLSAFMYGPDWKKFYSYDPTQRDVHRETRDMVIGGEATLWTHIVDATNLIPRVWPRASAMAERLWSSESMTNTDDAAFRLDEQRCRMLNRGIRAQPILNGYCGDQDLDYMDNYPVVE
ncbi:beta-hexosaminidase subunit beta-like isoform X1 [Dermacentor variabilis]|uniref:beta-hexosaminidase subunit beta-like isoform X1 n=1 Tax=Dermacentor variabilis TaxID=34621 RepID=UPI003F5C208D